MSKIEDAILAALVEECPQCIQGWHDNSHYDDQRLTAQGEVLAELVLRYVRDRLRPDARGGWET